MSSGAMIHQDWTRSRERSNRLMMRVMAWLSLYLGRRVARLMLHPIALYFLLFAPAARRASRAYLQRVLAPMGRSPAWRDVYRHFHGFASVVHDRLFLAADRVDLFDVEIHGQEHLLAPTRAGQGVFLMGAHLGSFDVVRASGRKLGGMQVTMVMHEGNARMFNAILASINPQSTQDIIALGHADSMLRVSQKLSQGHAIGILADRTPGDEARTAVSFLGAQAAFPTGPFRMAAVLQCPVIFMTGLYLGGNRYAIHFERIADFSGVARDGRDAAIGLAVRRYVALIEKYCRAAPCNWFNFFDFWQAPPHAGDKPA